MTILVTGGAGFIGSNYIHYLMQKHPDYKIVALDVLTYAANMKNLEGCWINSNFSLYAVNICSKGQVWQVFDIVKPDIVVHFAAESHVDNSINGPELFFQTNVMGTQLLLEMCLSHNVKRFHYVSTDEVYGDLPLDRPDLLFTESSPIKPSSPYSVSKASGDMLTLAYGRTYGLPVSVSRCSNNYGPYQHPEKLIPHMIYKGLEGKKMPIYGNGMNVRDWLYVEDHCKAIDMIIHENRTVNKIYNIGGNNEKQNVEIVKIICDKLNLPFYDTVQYVEDRKGHDLRYAIDATKIKTDLGWEPETSFDVGIEKTIDWYCNHKDWWNR